jgi:hypothetical protein
LNENEAIILYCSVEHELPLADGFEKALLYPSVHRILKTESGTKIEHLLATDLKGKLGNYQDGLLKGGLVDAHIRDMNSQEKLFQALK